METIVTQEQLTQFNLGENLDQLSNLDPRGYGVCRILYKASREKMGKPLSMNAAMQLKEHIHSGDLVYIITGFVLLPWGSAETDGIISSVLLARSLVLALDAKPVLIIPKECRAAVTSLAAVCGLHLYEDISDVRAYPASMGVTVFTKDVSEAKIQADTLAEHHPAFVIGIEAPGANKNGVYHNAVGLETTHLEAKSDILFDKLQKSGVPNIAIGDLGNELGMGAIGAQLQTHIPYTDGKCRCGCSKEGGIATGIAVHTVTDNIITATVSDWGCYGMIAALAYLCADIAIMHDATLQKEAMEAAARAGMIDMYGWAIPAIDGFGLTLTTSIVTSMRECVSYSLKLKDTCKLWFEKVLEKGFYE